MHDPRVMDPGGRQALLQGIPEAEFPEIIAVMNALRDWREAEARLSEASRRYMKLGDNDMRALRYVIVMTDAGDVATARGIAQHLGISSAATTKLLDRLEVGDHIRRTPHPSDRRALAIVINPTTREAAHDTVGREHARRFRVAAALTSEQRSTVVAFLRALSNTSEGEWSHAPEGAPQAV